MTDNTKKILYDLQPLYSWRFNHIKFLMKVIENTSIGIFLCRYGVVSVTLDGYLPLRDSSSIGGRCFQCLSVIIYR